MKVYGRDKEEKLLKELLVSGHSEFVGVTGRRRIGKTFLVDAVYENHMVFSMTGIKDGSLEEQLVHFMDKLAYYTKQRTIGMPRGWQEALILLKYYLEKKKSKKKRVIFLDEVPWLATPKSNFLQVLAHFWNDYLSKTKNYILVVCGSSTSWITSKVYNDKGGLHNRITAKINLQPFTLKETKQFLASKSIKLTDNAIVELYMICGGVPFYLNAIKKGQSPTVAIEQLCFSAAGLLYNEYENLFKALYENAGDHEAMVQALALSRQGLSRKELINKSKVGAGGPFTRVMNDLLLSGFVEEQLPYGKKKRGAIYRLIDEYCIFYHRFMSKNRKLTKGLWQQLSAKQTYKIWKGYAFENLCLRHVEEIKKALGISAVYTEVASYRQEGKRGKNGFQIDLLLDRADNTINICECKYYSTNYEFTKSYAETIRKRKALFQSATKTKKMVFNTMITNYPLEENQYSTEVVDSRVVVGELF